MYRYTPRQHVYRPLVHLITLLALALTFVPHAASAATTFVLGSSTANWTPLVCSGGSISNCRPLLQDPGPNGDRVLRWGDSSFVSSKSGLGYKGFTNVSITEGEAFDIGTLWHYNVPVADGTSLTSVRLGISLAFTSPTGLTSSHLFTFAIDETPNAGKTEDCEYQPSTTVCADAITFPSSFSSETFNYNSRVYALEIVGFENASGATMTQLISQENGNNSAKLVARIVDVTPNRAPTVDAGADVAGNEGNAIAVSASVADLDVEDTLTATWSYSTVSGTDAGATCTFADANTTATTITCTDDGVYQATLTAHDGEASGSDSVLITVGNVAPTIEITAPVDGALYANGTAVALESVVGDAGTNDTHTCAIAWGDGTSDAAAASGGCAGTHTFTTPGVYVIEATVTDDDEAAATDTVMVVVYSPEGAVTGGGSITSPAGAYAADPALSGKATFGFVSKYQKGATVPTGNTQFQFHAGGFNVHSITYDWLVVAGSTAQFKGTATVNGASADAADTPYQFMVWAGDGAPDTFRMKVWTERGGSETIVYDNGSNQALGNGSIVIHKK